MNYSIESVQKMNYSNSSSFVLERVSKNTIFHKHLGGQNELFIFLHFTPVS